MLLPQPVRQEKPKQNVSTIVIDD